MRRQQQRTLLRGQQEKRLQAWHFLEEVVAEEEEKMKMAAEELARADEERLQAWDLLEEVVFLFTGYGDGLPMMLQFWITSLSLGMAMASPMCTSSSPPTDSACVLD